MKNQISSVGSIWFGTYGKFIDSTYAVVYCGGGEYEIRRLFDNKWMREAEDSYFRTQVQAEEYLRKTAHCESQLLYEAEGSIKAFLSSSLLGLLGDVSPRYADQETPCQP